MIPAIETQYKGYRFRSRTEARWAVYFDTLGIKWEYERDGYDLGGSLGYYLPDFWLPQVNMWAEVKGEEFTSHERAKCCALAKLTGNGVLLLNGVPDIIWYTAIYYHPESNELFEEECGVSDYHRYHIDEHRFYGAPGAPTPDEEGVSTDRQYLAVRAARSARFEHGESPL
jgi:hypothetical protein